MDGSATQRNPSGFWELQKAGDSVPGSFAWYLSLGLCRLVGCLWREFFADHRGRSLGALPVPAEDEAGHDDPEGEKSNKSGTGGDGDHFLSPSGVGEFARFVGHSIAGGCYADFALM